MPRLIITTLLLLVVFQSLLFAIYIFFSGTNQKLIENSYSSIVKSAQLKRRQIERLMATSWGNSDLMSKVINQVEVIRKTESFDSLHSQLSLAEAMLNMMDSMKVSGSILVMNNNESTGKGGILYLHDNNINLNSPDLSDISLRAGNPSVAEALKIPISNSWKRNAEPDEIFKCTEYHNIYSQNAIDLARTSGNLNVGAWEDSVNIDGKKVWHYIRPLFEPSTYKQYGMLIIEVEMNDIENTFDFEEFSDKSTGAYILAKKENKTSSNYRETYKVLAIRGTYIKNLLSGDEFSLNDSNISDQLNSITDDETKISILDVNSSENFIAIREPLRIKNNTFVTAGEYYLFAITDQAETEAASRQYTNTIIAILAFSIFAGFVLALWVARKLTRNISIISKEITENKGKNFNISPSNIVEFDNLVNVINELSNRLIKASERFQAITELSSASIVAIEINENTGTAYKVGRFSGIFDNIVDGESFEEEMSLDNFYHLENIILSDTEIISGYYDEDSKSLIEVLKKVWNGKEVYLKIITNIEELPANHSPNEKPLVFKSILDNTYETVEQLKIKKQRDLDSLTGLLNRLSFKEKVQKFIDEDKEHSKKVAMVMWDLDELKFVNDTYGHDQGDEYIITMANTLKALNSENSFVARVSGDEFFAFIEYENSKSEVLDKLAKIRNGLTNTLLHFSNKQMSIKATTGVAWYPDDSVDGTELTKYADFAMYTAKHYKKGTISEFNREEYDKNYILLSGNQYFYEFLEKKQVRYAFQPIVDARTGEIFAYEALMRSTSEHLENIGQIMKFAKTQSRLTDIEIITFEETLRIFSENLDKFKDRNLFINSIANVALPQERIDFISVEYRHVLNRLVIEIIEQEDIEDNSLKIKQNFKKDYGCKMAIDDYGSGYSTQTWFLQVHPEFVKIDMTLTRGIDKDFERRAILENILSYSQKMNIKVLCEGVETRDEMTTLIEMGVDYLQGYYLSKPQFEIVEIPENVKKEIEAANNIKEVRI